MWIQQVCVGCFKFSVLCWGCPDLSWGQTLYPFSHRAPYSMWLSGQPVMSWCVSCLLQAGLALLRFVWICLLHAALKVLAMRLCLSPRCTLQTWLIFLNFLFLWGIVWESFSRATSCLAREVCVAHFPALK